MKLALLLPAAAAASAFFLASVAPVLVAATAGDGGNVSAYGRIGNGGDAGHGPGELLPGTSPLEVLDDKCIAAFAGVCPNRISKRGVCCSPSPSGCCLPPRGSSPFAD